MPDPLQLQKGSIRVITAQLSSLSQWLCSNSGNCNDDPALISLFVAAGQLDRQQLPLDLGVLFSDWWRTVFDILLWFAVGHTQPGFGGRGSWKPWPQQLAYSAAIEMWNSNEASVTHSNIIHKTGFLI